jgi:hypothetical protein
MKSFKLNDLLLSLVTLSGHSQVSLAADDIYEHSGAERQRRLLPSFAVMNFELRAEQPSIVAARAALEQVIINVVADASDTLLQGNCWRCWPTPSNVF